MSAEVLRRLRAHRQFDAFLLRAIELLQAEGEGILRAEDLVHALAKKVAAAPGGHQGIDSALETLVLPDERGFAEMSFLLLEARIERARNKAKVMGMHFVVEPRVFEALMRGESAPLDGFHMLPTEDADIVSRELLQERRDGESA